MKEGCMIYRIDGNDKKLESIVLAKKEEISGSFDENYSIEETEILEVDDKKYLQPEEILKENEESDLHFKEMKTILCELLIPRKEGEPIYCPITISFPQLFSGIETLMLKQLTERLLLPQLEEKLKDI